MAIRAGAEVISVLDQIDTVKQFSLGYTVDMGDSAFVYVQGVTSGAANKFATYTSAGVTTLLAANAVGLVGVFCAALDATTKYGWLQVKALAGRNGSTDTVSANTVPYIDGTAGRVDDSSVAGDKVYNAMILTADTSNVATVYLNYPYVTNESN
tara:strand:+ start:1114 stop:1575 length:462 start_codon:yes stop_codon:yes gene_type:complete